MVHSMTLDERLADDLVQDVFLRAFRGLGSFDGRARFTTWLYRIAMNITHDTLARRRRSPIDGRAELPPAAACPAEPPEAEAEAARIEGCSRATISWRLHEAKKRLAVSLRHHATP